MATFTIETKNNIAAHAGQPSGAENLQFFASEKELRNLAAGVAGRALCRGLE